MAAKRRTLEQVIRKRVYSSNYRADAKGIRGRLKVEDAPVPTTCPFCDKKLGVSNLSLDHIIPISLGGENTWANVWWTDKTCNRYRGNFTVEEFREFLKLLKDAGWLVRFYQHYRPRSFRAKR